MDMLPVTEKNPQIQLATDKFAREMGKKVVFIFSSKDEKQAIEVSDIFAKKLKNTKMFSGVDYSFGDEYAKDFYDIFFKYRFSTLSYDNRELVKNNNIDAFCKNALNRLYQPIDGVTGTMITEDPFFLFMSKVESMPKMQGNFLPVDGHLVYENNDEFNVLVTATVSDNVRGSQQVKLVKNINSLIGSLHKKFRNVNSRWTGMIKFSARAQSSAQREVSRVGLGSIIGIILLFIISFKSVKELFTALIPVFAGLVFAWGITGFIFDKVHVITLVFGASVIGVSIDYSFHYFAHARFEKFLNSDTIIKAVLPGLTLGMLTSLAGYLSLAAAPFPGMRQMAIFSSTGLVGAYATVILFFKYLKLNPAFEYKPFLWKVALAVSQKSSMLLKITVLILVTGTAGMFWLKANDDIRLLSSKQSDLLHEENQVKKMIGAVDRSRFVLVNGQNYDELETNEEHIVNILEALKTKGALKSFLAISMVIPSKKIQQENLTFMDKLIHSDCAADYFNTLGFTDDDIGKLQKNILSGTLKFDDVKSRISVAPYSMFKIGQSGNINSSVIMLDTIKDEKSIKNKINKTGFAVYVDRVSDISDLFGRYRKISTIISGIAYLGVFLFLIFRYGFKQGILTITPPLAAAVTILGGMGYLGIHANIFTFFALMMVLAIGIDYTLFFTESSNNHDAVSFAIFLSAITTLLSFGLLAVSSTAAISHIGFVMLFGIVIVTFLSPIAKREN
ncbi:MAG: hypothetical protein JXR91_17825 [Deltaproteobacteria bacterium]|nr:hypothetical protein [Deltaproteobacteria bacterium]